MQWYQRKLTLSPKSRGFHLITRDILKQIPEIVEIQIGFFAGLSPAYLGFDQP